ncbi:hypothetical protein W03_00280 [Nitrosomonas sp. PY1]|uniref:hypothetical protein n=1 Tax=Nitrosomonas sp. PY1 TaxID=1803906 RepID=UPI001FC87344|nr:hypothetical protein [Nitrosomonas sp. PY1]GKS68024.1 hypothetical protein W03_00280 [Nitrosomonas sp. PY1]
MKKLWQILLILMLFISLSGFRAPNDAIISNGDFIDKLISNMGRPHVKINLDPIYNTREMWIYRIDEYNYRFTIINGRIAHFHWSRF